MARMKQMALVGLAGGALLVLGSVLPWATISSGFGTVNTPGTDGDGLFTLAFGAVIILAAVMAFGGSRLGTLSVAGFGILALVLVGSTIGNISKAVAEMTESEEFIRASVGIGLWVAGLGALLATVGGIGAIRVSKQRQSQPDATPAGLGEKLAELAELRDRGVITAEEYETKQAALVDRF